MRPLERNGLIEPWFDGYLIPGDDFDREIRKALADSDFIGLLVTPRFLASDYCVDIEMEDAISRHQKGEARVVPIIAKPCGWKTTSLAKLVATPTDGVPITKWDNVDEAWNIVAEDVERAARKQIKASRSAPPTRPAETERHLLASPLPVPRSSKPTDEQIDDFKHAALETIAGIFEASIGALDGDLTGRFRRLDANRFTATLYRNGKKVEGCTIYTGAEYFGSRGIAYNASDDGGTKTMSDELAIEVGKEGLALRPGMGMSSRGADQLLTPEEGAERLWKSFTWRLTA